ncbi:MAG: M48 family metalloprotease, partial [Candidatus Omnitrophota bacterium]
MTLYITELFGSQNVTIPTLTRPWIVPDEIIISESLDSAYVHKATLKVMLEQDYLTGNRVQGIGYSQYEFKDPRLKVLNEYSSQLIRENIIPKLSKRINTSKDYAPLRQAYYSLILAQWFKARNANKNTQYSRLINKKDLSNLESKIPYSVNTYFNAYKDNFEKGEYNIQEPAYTPYGQVIRSYFSGGVVIFPETTPFHDALNQPIGTPSSTLLSRAPKEAMPNQHEIALEINGNTVTKPTAAAEKENSPKIEETPTSAPTAVTQDNGPTKNISPTGQLYIKGIISIAGVIIAISVGGHLGLGIALAAIAIDFFGKQIKLFFSGVAGLRGRSRSSPQKYPDSIVQHSRWGISGSGSIQIKDSNNVLRKLMVTQVKPPQITELALRLASRCIDPAHKELINSLLGIIADLPEQEKPRFYAYDAVIENSPYFYSSSKKVIALQKEILNDPKAGDIALAQSILEYLISANQLAISEGNGILIISFKEKRVFIRDDAKKNTAFIRNDSHLRTHILLQSLIGTLFFADDALENKTDEINQSSLERADFRARYMDSLALISLLGDFNSNQPPSAKAIQKEAARLRQQAHIHEALDETARDSASYPSRDSYVIEDTRAQKRLEEILTNILSKNGLPKSLLRIAILEGSSPNAFINPASPFTVFVHRGLLNNAHEDTIAWILAHEISHHIFYLKKILQNRWKLFKGGTSPGQEEHADILGLRMADRAGYNVSYAAQFFDLTPDHSPKEHNAPYQRKKNLQAYISQTAFRNKHKEPGFRFPESIPLRPVNPQPYARAGEFIESPEVNNLNVSMINTYERLKQNIAQLLNNRAENTPEAYREYCGTFLNLTAQARDLSDKDGFSFISREWAFHLYAIYTQMLRVSFPGSSQLHQQLFEAVAGLQQKNKEVYFNLGLVDRWFGLEASRYAEEYQKAQMPDFQVFAGGLKNNLPALIDRVKRRESYGKFGSAAHIFLSLPHQELIQQLGLEEYLQLILNYPVEATMGIREAGNEKIAAIATDQGISADERFNRLNRVYDIWQEYRNRTGYVLFYLNELVETCASKGVNGFDLVRIFPIEYCRSHNFYIFFSNFTEQQKQEILLFEINRSQPDASKINVVLRERPYLSAEFLTSYEGLVRAKDLAKNIKDWLLGAIFDARCQAEIYQDSYYYHSLTAGQRNYPNLPRGSPLPLNKLREIFGNDDRTVIEGIANLDFLDAHRKNAFLYAYYQQRVHELQGEERFLLLAMALNHFEFDQESSRGNKDSLAHDISWEITRQRGALMTPADTAEYSRQQGSFLDGKYYFVDFATDTPRTQPDLALIEQARQEGFIIWFESRIRQQSNPEAKLAAINSILTRASPLKDTFLEPLIEEILQQRNPDLTLALRIANLMRTPDLSVSYKLKVLDRKIGNIKQEGAAPQETRERILNSILEYFPQPSLIRDDILDSYIEDYVKALDEYRGLKTLYFSFSASDGRSIEGEAQDTVVDELTKQTNLAVYYLNKIPGYDQKVEFLLWVMGIRKVKPPVVQKLELMLKMNLDYLPQRFMQKEDYGNLRNIGKSVNQHIFHGLLWDKENGLATDAESGNTEGLWKNFTTALYENIIGKPEGMLYDIWETFFLLSPAKNWQITESA